MSWFQEQTLETACDAFLFCVERGLVETYFSMWKSNSAPHAVGSMASTT